MVKVVSFGCRINSYESEIFKEKLAFSLYMISRNGKLEPPYYVSEKEAEAALEKMKEGK